MSFCFKQFGIDDTLCAMKVGTDGVLLGAWADVGAARNVLDIGTGSGLVAIMLAQRFSHAVIKGIDIDSEAACQAACNMKASPWAERLSADCADFLEWNGNADAMVCNPPFFANSLRCPEQGRRTARHDDSLPLDMLMKHAARILPQGGVLAVVLPADSQLIVPEGMSLRRRCMVRTVERRAPKRQLLEYVKGVPPVGGIQEETLVLATPDGQRTDEHKALTRDFYLNI